MTVQYSVSSSQVHPASLQDFGFFHERTDFDYVGFRPSGLIRLMVTRSFQQLLGELPPGCHMQGYLVAMRGGIFECGINIETPDGELHQRAYGNRVSKLLSNVQSRMRAQLQRRKPRRPPTIIAIPSVSPLH